MAIVTSIELWKDVGFLEDSAETPLRTSSLPTVDLTVTEGINPTKGRLFTQFKLKGEWADLYEMSYMRITYNFKAGNISLYAWVDDVSVISDTDTSPVTLVSFHIDLWRSYINSVVLGRGTVTRRPENGTLRPPQGYTVLQMNQNSFESLVPVKDEIYWVYFTYTAETGSTTTHTSTMCFPVYKKSRSIYMTGQDEFGNNVNGKFPVMRHVISGTWDEELALTPSRIKGAFISPVGPFQYRLQSYGSTVDYTDEMIKSISSSEGGYGWVLKHGATGRNRIVLYCDGQDTVVAGGVYTPLAEYTRTLTQSYTTTDLTNAVITGFDGETVGVIPYSRSVSTYKYRMIVSTVSAYIQIRFDGIKSHQEGICFTIPCPVLEVTENSYSEYNYTGARDYDKASRAEEERYAKETQAIDATTSLVTGVLTTGIAGIGGGSAAMTNILGKMGVNTPKPFLSEGAASVGGFVGLSGILEGASSLASLGVHNVLNLETNHNANLDRISNDYYARQSDGLILPGTGFDFMLNGREVGITEMKADSYSQQIAENTQSQYGVEVFEPRASCDNLLVQGPLQIMNLNITGDAPVAAKEYIKARLQRGVLLV